MTELAIEKIMFVRAEIVIRYRECFTIGQCFSAKKIAYTKHVTMTKFEQMLLKAVEFDWDALQAHITT